MIGNIRDPKARKHGPNELQQRVRKGMATLQDILEAKLEGLSQVEADGMPEHPINLEWRPHTEGRITEANKQAVISRFCIL